MISKFSLLFGKPKKALCGVFCGKNISEFNNSWKQRGEKTILNLKSLHLKSLKSLNLKFSFKYKTLFKILY